MFRLLSGRPRGHLIVIERAIAGLVLRAFEMYSSEALVNFMWRCSGRDLESVRHDVVRHVDVAQQRFVYRRIAQQTALDVVRGSSIEKVSTRPVLSRARLKRAPPPQSSLL